MPASPVDAAPVQAVPGVDKPCPPLNRHQPSLMAAVLDRDADGRLLRKAGVMAVVIAGGPVGAGDTIRVVMPAAPYHAMDRV